MYGGLQPIVTHHRLNSFFQDLPSMSSFSLKGKSRASKLMIQPEVAQAFLFIREANFYFSSCLVVVR